MPRVQCLIHDTAEVSARAGVPGVLHIVVNGIVIQGPAQVVKAYRDHQGQVHALDVPEFSEAGVDRCEWEVRSEIYTELLGKPGIFDVLCTKNAGTGVNVWVIPEDSAAGLPSGFRSWWEPLRRKGIELAGIAILPKFPVGAGGGIDFSQLPPPGALKLQEDSAAKTPAPARMAALQETAHRLSLTKLHSGSPTGGNVLLVGTDSEAIAIATILGTQEDFDASLFVVKDLEDAHETNNSAQLNELLSGLRDLRIISFGKSWQTACWLLRSLNQTPQNSSELLCLGPEVEGDAGGSDWTERISGFFGGLFAKQGTGGKRGSGSKRRSRNCTFSASVLTDGPPEKELIERFPFGDFYDADLSTPAGMAAAILDVYAAASGVQLPESSLEEEEEQEEVEQADVEQVEDQESLESPEALETPKEEQMEPVDSSEEEHPPAALPEEHAGPEEDSKKPNP